MADQKLKWYWIGATADQIVPEGQLSVLEVAHKKISVCRWEGKLYAFAYKCPHAGGVLADGYLDAMGNVVCPLHRYKFNINNGRNVSGEGYYLVTYPVEKRPDGLYVGFAESSFWNFLK